MMKMKLHTFIVCLIIASVLIGCATLIPAEKPLPTSTLIQTETYTGAIFSAPATEEHINWFDGVTDSTWTPTADDVAKLEAGLAEFLLESDGYNMYETRPIVERLSDYSRQYFGIVQADEPLVFINFFCGELDDERQENPVIVEDGGNCYFQVVYDVDADTFTSLRVNGES